MHVVLTPSWYPDRHRPHNGSFFRDQARMLQRGGMRVGVIALEPVSFWQARRELTADVEEGIVVVRGTVPTIPKGALPGDRVAARAVAARAVRLYEETIRNLPESPGNGGAWVNPDVVHAHSVFTGIHVGRYAAEHWDAGLAITEHRPSSTDRNVHGWRYRALRRDLKRAGGRAVVSTPFAEALRDYWRLGEWRSIALPVNDEVFDVPRPADQDRQGDSARALTVCHVSHLGRNKRPEETIRAVARLARADLAAGREPTRLILVGGETHEIEPLRELARAEGIEQTSTFTGRVPHDEVGGLMAASDVFVLASEVEAGGTVLAEAQALGLACVATPTWAGRFMVEPETGLVLPAAAQADDNALVASLTEALTRVTDSIRAGGYCPEAIRARARQRFGEATFVKACRELYEQACGEITGSAGSTGSTQ